RPGIPKRYANTPFMRWLIFPKGEEMPKGNVIWNADIEVLIAEKMEAKRIESVLERPTFEDEWFSIWIKEKQ
ncbi:MAG: hypothetical protein VX278_11395, partial [Myxococcota bacterium]|nr:hypothetical protein [Myxococcota bacterium]